MNNAIIVNYDPFAMKSDIYVITDGEQYRAHVSSDMRRLADDLIRIAYGRNIYSIKVNASSTTIEEIKKLVSNFEQNMYSNNRISIEGI